MKKEYSKQSFMIFPNPLHLPPRAMSYVKQPLGCVFVAVLRMDGLSLCKANGPAPKMNQLIPDR